MMRLDSQNFDPPLCLCITVCGEPLYHTPSGWYGRFQRTWAVLSDVPSKSVSDTHQTLAHKKPDLSIIRPIYHYLSSRRHSSRNPTCPFTLFFYQLTTTQKQSCDGPQRSSSEQ